jgi:hypothetical protein
MAGTSAGTRWWAVCLGSHPTGATLNLIRKELLLQKPIFLIAAVLSLCWLVTLTLLLLAPEHQETFEIILNLLTAIYVAVLPLLAGCISLGEEKALGLTAWHLTLPISARRQWLLKLAVSATVAVVLGFVLPFLLAWLTAVKAKVGLFHLMHGSDNGMSLVLSLWGLTFLMSFWAVTLLANTLRAALASVISLLALGLCGGLAVCFSLLIGPLESGLWLLATAYLHLPLDFFLTLAIKYGVFLVIFSVVITILGQSLAQFRRAQTPGRTIWKYSVVLAAAVFLVAFWLADVANSASGVDASLLQQDLSNALSSLPASESEPASSVSQKVSWKELEQTGKLSVLTTTWLKNASISFAPAKGGLSVSQQTFQATIEFPNGGRSEVYFAKPSFRKKAGQLHNGKIKKQTTGEKQ